MRRVILIAFAFALALAWQAFAQQPKDYTGLIQRSAQNEKLAMQNRQRLQFFERKQSDWGSETRAVIETSGGRVDRIIAFNDQPLTPEQVAKQEQRLKKLLKSPEALRHEVMEQRGEDQRRELLVTTLPDAFLMEFVGVEPNGQLRFSFAPNPKFSPKNRETQVFKGMRGWLWIDPKDERIARAQGTLFKDVSFGWGIVGHLHKGGRFEVIQTEVSPGAWRITTLDLDFKGRKLLFSSLRILQKEISTCFSATAPEMSLEEALNQLLLHPSSAVDSYVLFPCGK
jgi:hypothetical protein